MTRLKLGLGALALAAVVFVAWSAWDRDAIMAWKEEAGALPFFGAMAVLPAVGMPITPFFVLAGATFGVGPGLLGSGVALGLNLTLCYAIARSGLRPKLESLLRRFEYELPGLQGDREERAALHVAREAHAGRAGRGEELLARPHGSAVSALLRGVDADHRRVRRPVRRRRCVPVRSRDPSSARGGGGRRRRAGGGPLVVAPAERPA